LAKCRAYPMKSSAAGLIVRFLNVTMPTLPYGIRRSTGAAFKPECLPAQPQSRRGKESKNATSGNQCPAQLQEVGRHEISWRSKASFAERSCNYRPATLSFAGRHQGSSTSSASSILRRRAHLLSGAAATTNASENRNSARKCASGSISTPAPGRKWPPCTPSRLYNNRSCRGGWSSAPKGG
jgi:hypothetical protein